MNSVTRLLKIAEFALFLQLIIYTLPVGYPCVNERCFFCWSLTVFAGLADSFGGISELRRNSFVLISNYIALSTFDTSRCLIF
jgi:hypothetical protein